MNTANIAATETDITRVLIVDDHVLFRQGLRRVLEMEPDLQIAGEAASGSEALNRTVELKPHVVLMDLTMPGMNGVEAARVIKERVPGIAVLALTIHETEEYLVEAIKAGVDGYILKDVEGRAVAEAIRMARRGQAYVHPGMAGKLINRFARLARLAEQAGLDRPDMENTRPEELSEREFEVLGLFARGHDIGDIAGKLFISEKTVRNHSSSIFRKLGVRDRTQAVVHAIKRGWVSP